jgi:hypothetical protein
MSCARWALRGIRVYFVHRSLRIGAASLVLSLFSCAIGFPQSSRVAMRAPDPALIASLPTSSRPCASESSSAPADSKTPLNVPAGLRSANIAAMEALPVCDIPTFTSAPLAASVMVDPCKVPNGVRTSCGMPADPAQMELRAMGKAGQMISRAREKALQILENQNACSAWFQRKDSNPAATFRTLSFELDRKGDEYILESRDLGPWNIFRSPYVARVMQGDGSYATVTINAKGAFFRAQATVQEIHKEGGPRVFRGDRILRVGPYTGETLSAQVVTLLHEFGHLIDLLPTDWDDLDGKSLHNTDEVLRHCGATVDALGGRGTFSASR